MENILTALAPLFVALTPILLGVLAWDSKRSTRKLDAIQEVAVATHALTNDNLTQTKRSVLAATEGWATSVEANPNHDDNLLRQLRTQIEALKQEIKDRDAVAAANLPPAQSALTRTNG